MDFIKQNKGKALDKLPKSFNYEATEYIVTTKYDGNYVQIHFNDKEVKFYTSGGKEFYDVGIAKTLMNYAKRHLDGDVWVIEAEYIGTDGKLGDRVNSSTGSYRSQFEKGIRGNTNGTFMVFNVITEVSYRYRWLRVMHLIGETTNSRLRAVDLLSEGTNIQRASVIARAVVDKGYEGVVAVHIGQVYQSGKRTNNIIKIKYRPTADLMCVGTEEGEGKYVGMIGSLIVQDSEGIRVRVGSGLNDSQRRVDPRDYIGKVVEISYEQKLDTYVQPVFVTVRDDKTKGE